MAAASGRVGGQDSSMGTGPAGIIADAWVLAPLGSAQRKWSRLDWRGVFPVQRCRHSAALVGDLCIVYGGYDGARVIDEHHSLFAAPLGLAALVASRQGAADVDPDRAPPRAQPSRSSTGGSDSGEGRQDRWDAERPFGEHELPAAERERAERSKLPLAVAKCLHRHAIKADPPRDTYIDPDTSYSVFTSAYLKRRPCCGNACRHCPWGHVNVPGRARQTREDSSEEEGLEW